MLSPVAPFPIRSAACSQEMPSKILYRMIRWIRIGMVCIQASTSFLILAADAFRSSNSVSSIRSCHHGTCMSSLPLENAVPDTGNLDCFLSRLSVWLYAFFPLIFLYPVLSLWSDDRRLYNPTKSSYSMKFLLPLLHSLLLPLLSCSFSFITYTWVLGSASLYSMILSSFV